MNMLLLSALLVLAGPAEAQVDDVVCSEALEIYRKAPSVRTLEPLFPCLDDASVKLRAEIMDKIICREIWADPNFNRAVVARLRVVIKKYDRGSAVYDPVKDTSDRLLLSSKASSLEWWIHNWEHEIDPEMLAQRGREEAAHQRRMARSTRSIKFNIFQLALMLFFYLAFIVKSLWRSRRLREAERGNSGPGAQPGVKVI